ncbi:TPA: restriction endonuclease subunit S [Vibrio parahaemolyticus]|uniref:restriction endonuclease subunit S n=1 Tax=Vibrio parahaemolyticus TaxID=670 RepID=UPI0003FE4A15|nr:restriction endonuclease subunit S [Vibrio parahaemolyticus]MDF4765603.1 restriction endonuclease subunit S [Vibrio parahaemolyticus]HBC3406510.1 restriction endonuclease subunit S [Vibrio parahaemolyticus]HBH7869371.1 restriction endonuclease subunit S [Vibrio parahaemolyticus]HBN6094687.1 restriction endonuclease subunit S [Vibrio parahaemolyticus]HBN6184542.1 restriction endonuclease subunit S [Vibrio parahaemolyticus]
MGKYQAYPEYKDSGVEWLDSIPSSWESAPIKYMALSKTSLFLDGDWIESKDISEEGIRYITTGNVGEGFYKEQGMGFITQETFKKLNCTEVYEGDILISRLNNPIGRACIVPDLGHRIVTSVDNVIFRPDSTYDERFLVYLFSSKDYFKHTSNLARGATMQRISRGLLGNIRVVFPIKEEQIQIANFLDRETAKIDTLIEKQQQLIKLLKEKRQAVISHAVTKGLNPQAPMKDSGVEWLGEVPEHWETARFKFLCESIIAGPFGSSITKDMYQPSGYKVYGQEQVIPNNFQLGDYFISEKDYEQLSRYKVESGDLLISCVGTFGKIAVFPNDAQEGIINPRLIKAKLKSNQNAFYIRELLKSEMIFKQFELLSRGGTMGVINIAILNEIIAAAPPLTEQDEIYSYICIQKEKYRLLIDKATRQIELLKERRTALISAAVTGKIDVRNWQAPISQDQALEQTA